MYYFEMIGNKGQVLGVQDVPEEDLMEFLTCDFGGRISYRYLCFVPGEALIDCE